MTSKGHFKRRHLPIWDGNAFFSAGAHDIAADAHAIATDQHLLQVHDRDFGQALLVFGHPQPALVLGDEYAALFDNQMHEIAPSRDTK
jgi:hypothetical protein